MNLLIRLNAVKLFTLCISIICINISCQKIEYTVMESPAYLRIFNSINTPELLEYQGAEMIPYLCILINPIFNSLGEVVDAEVIGDHLDKRVQFAPPYPVHIGASTSENNPEYPGKRPVLVGPILNGFDLSSWAQIKPGKKKIIFYYRPKNNVPFFSLRPEERKNIAAQGEYELKEGEVYTMQIIIDDFNTKSKKIINRKENFHKVPFDNEKVYVSFYNYSAKNFANTSNDLKHPNGVTFSNLFSLGIKDTMDIYMTLYRTMDYVPYLTHTDAIIFRTEPQPVQFFNRKYVYNLRRNTESYFLAPYISYPIWFNDDASKKISTDLWQQFEFIHPLISHEESNNLFSDFASNNSTRLNGGAYKFPMGNYAILSSLLNGPKIMKSNPDTYPISDAMMSVNVPNLIISTATEEYKSRSLSSVAHIEVINNNVYVMQIQRRYAPPKY